MLFTTAGWSQSQYLNTTLFTSHVIAHDLAACSTGHLFTPVITSSPSSITVCKGSTTNFTVTATGTGLTYSWELSTNGGSTWTAISNNSLYSNAHTSILTVTGITASMSGYQYHCIVSDGTPVTAGPATLTVNASTAPVVHALNGSNTICASGGGQLTTDPSTATSYQWQFSTDGGVTWSNTVDGAVYSGSFSASGSLFILSGAGLDGYLYHYLATDGSGCSATSAIDTLHVLAPVITAPVATSLTVCPNGTTTISAVANSPLSMTYQWQLGNANITDNSNYSGTATSALTISNVTTALNGFKYKVIVTDAHPCTSTSAQVTLIVPSVSITTQPVGTNVCAGSSVTLSATLGSTGGTPARQWQTDNGTTSAGGPVVWTNVATTTSLSLGTVTLAQDGYHYRVIVTSVGGCNAVTSGDAILHTGSSGTWLGGTDTNWHVASNWCGLVPVSTTDVYVPNWAPHMPTISTTTANAFWQSIKIDNSATLRITGGSYPYTLTGSAYNILGTVAYIAASDQNILPATHGSLIVGGTSTKLLSTNVDVTHSLTLGGSAKLVTGANILTMKAGSSPIGGASFGAASSWVVTGKGAAGAANTGLGGLRVEQINAASGAVLFPVGPDTTAYNPAYVSNSGITDNFTLAVNDQPLPGNVYHSGINNSWLLSEATAGGSNVALQLQWNQADEQSSYQHSSSQITRSDGSSIVQFTPVLGVSGSDPFATSGGAFSTLTEFSVASYTLLLPIRLINFTAARAGIFNQIDWQTDGQEQPLYYALERSADGSAFTEVARITAINGKVLYSYIDADPGNAVTYYRLRMLLDDSKTILYSRLVTVTNQLGAVRMELRPSITKTNETSLFVVLPRKTTLTCTLTDMIGRLQFYKVMLAEKGEQTIPLNVAGLAKGIYYLQIAGSDGTVKVLSLVRQ